MSYLIIGAGLMGRALVHDLMSNSGISEVISADIDASRLEALARDYGGMGLATERIDASDAEAVSRLIAGSDVVVNATTYRLNAHLSRTAIEHGCHMLDLGGNMDVVKEQLAMTLDAEKAGVSVLPNCGLAPGMANVMAAWMLSEHDDPTYLKIFVGGLPIEPVPPLNYMQLFSVEGLINEYIEPPEAIIDGHLMTLEPMGDVEEVEFPEPFGALEAFNTSGGISMMVKEYEGTVGTMYYKTLRYPGHRDVFKAMLDMGLMDYGPVTVDGMDASPRKVLERQLAATLPKKGPDATLMRIEVGSDGSGSSMTLIDRADEGSGMSSMMRTTAFPTSIMAQMVHDGTVTTRGVMTPERVIDGRKLLEMMRERNIEPELVKY